MAFVEWDQIPPHSQTDDPARDRTRTSLLSVQRSVSLAATDSRSIRHSFHPQALSWSSRHPIHLFHSCYLTSFQRVLLMMSLDFWTRILPVATELFSRYQPGQDWSVSFTLIYALPLPLSCTHTHTRARWHLPHFSQKN